MSKWYYETNEWAKSESEKYGVPLYKFVGIVAATSVNTKWETNKVKAVNFLLGERKHIKFVLDKCEKILAAKSEEEVVKILNGPKITSFYFNILKPHTSKDVTIDRWALRDVFGSDVNPTPKRIRIAKEHYVNIAKSKGILPHQAQAHAWEKIRK